MAQESARLSRLIEDFLTFSRMERGRTKFERDILRAREIREIIDAAIDVVSDRLRAPGCDLEVNFAPDIPDITGDRDALVTAIVNLLDNAIKYSGDMKKIKVSCFAADGFVCFEVRDNGIGFPRSAAKKIFDRFYQVDNSLSRRAGGCGLGLSIVKFIISAHGGEISAQSRPGQGSVFTARLPQN
jgi:signal transduction histidine kinase